ncbi:hypothetical protein A3J41_00095 [candidate division TM6 bacterium RIFCSPHIGHO2_12_FULL_38_8]|nr:MAG: hypothetical protein A3J41_00095 [candidate division TM6 bacterium RIFCSPHIGHO2_12_FULL_38_8]
MKIIKVMLLSLMICQNLFALTTPTTPQSPITPPSSVMIMIDPSVTLSPILLAFLPATHEETITPITTLYQYVTVPSTATGFLLYWDNKIAPQQTLTTYNFSQSTPNPCILTLIKNQSNNYQLLTQTEAGNKGYLTKQNEFINENYTEYWNYTQAMQELNWPIVSLYIFEQSLSNT